MESGSSPTCPGPDLPSISTAWPLRCCAARWRGRNAPVGLAALDGEGTQSPGGVGDDLSSPEPAASQAGDPAGAPNEGTPAISLGREDDGQGHGVPRRAGLREIERVRKRTNRRRPRPCWPAAAPAAGQTWPLGRGGRGHPHGPADGRRRSAPIQAIGRFLAQMAFNVHAASWVLFTWGSAAWSTRRRSISDAVRSFPGASAEGANPFLRAGASVSSGAENLKNRVRVKKKEIGDLMRGRPRRIRDVLELRPRCPSLSSSAPTPSRRCRQASTSNSVASSAPVSLRPGRTSSRSLRPWRQTQGPDVQASATANGPR